MTREGYFLCVYFYPITSGDITYLALAMGHWAYLACRSDAFSRRMVGGLGIAGATLRT